MNLYSVLLVDDEEEVYSVIMKKLDWEAMGFRIAGYARNGVEALEMAEEIQPDVVMTDIKMPYMDGLTLSKKLKELYQKIKIIIFSKNCKYNIYKFILTGFRDADITFEPESLRSYGNVIGIVDETKPSYDFDKLLEENKGNLLGRYIESLRECEDGSVAHMALYEGVQALLDTKRS